MIRNTILFTGALCLMASAALAQARPETPNMTCASAKALVTQRGAVVLHTGADTYDRYVRDQGFCEREDTIQPARVPTIDSPQCFVGYRCIFNTNDNGGDIPN